MPLKLLIQEEGGKHRQVKAPENHIRIVMLAGGKKEEQNHLDFFKTGSGHIFPQHSYQNVVVEVSFPMDPRICTCDLYEICFGTTCE